jgi:hypothetical protein
MTKRLSVPPATGITREIVIAARAKQSSAERLARLRTLLSHDQPVAPIGSMRAASEFRALAAPCQRCGRYHENPSQPPSPPDLAALIRAARGGAR